MTQFRSLLVPATLSDNIASNVGITDQRLAGKDLDVSIRHLTETVCRHVREETDKNHDKPVRIVEGPPKFKPGTSLKQIYSDTANLYSWPFACCNSLYILHTQGYTNCPQSYDPFRIVGARTVKRGKFLNYNPQILGTTIQNLETRYLCTLAHIHARAYFGSLIAAHTHF